MILVVSNMYPSPQYPNYGIFVKNFVDELAVDHEVKVIALHKKKSRLLKLAGYLSFYVQVFINYVFGKYDLVYVHYAGYNSPPILWGRKLNPHPKLIVNVHGSDVTPEKRLEAWTNSWTGKLVKQADLTVVPSSYFREVVINRYGMIPAFISPSAGVNRQLFKPQVPIIKKSEQFIIGYVSRLDAQKGWDLVLKAFKEVLELIPNAHLIMVGGGAEEQLAMEMIMELGLTKHVERIQMLSQSELVEIYTSLDVFIFPSTRAGESLGLVGLEAMACGVPVIGSDFGGIKTYVEDQVNGYLFKPGNLKDLKESILKYAALSNARKESMQQAALRTAERYDSQLVTKQLIQKIGDY